MSDKVTNYALQLAGGQTYYFVVRAYNTSGRVVPSSVEVPFNVPGSPTPTVAPPPSVTGLSPNSGPVGTSITISGSSFGATRDASM